MNISFETEELREQCIQQESVQGTFGMTEARAFREFLANARSASKFLELRTVESSLHDIGEGWAWVAGRSRVTLGSGHSDKTTPYLEDGSIEWDCVTRIRIMSVEHD